MHFRTPHYLVSAEEQAASPWGVSRIISYTRCHCDSFDLHGRLHSLSSRFFFLRPHTVIFINITLSKHQSQTAVSLLFNIQLYQTVIIKWIFSYHPKSRIFAAVPNNWAKCLADQLGDDCDNWWLNTYWSILDERTEGNSTVKPFVEDRHKVLHVWKEELNVTSTSLYLTIVLPSTKQTNLKLENCPVTGTYYDHRAKRSVSVLYSYSSKVEATRGLAEMKTFC